MQAKKKILVLIDWFLPGIKAGGPVKSVSSMIKTLHTQYDFYVLTSDTDFGDIVPYKTVSSDKWIPYSENVQINYLSKRTDVGEAFLAALAFIQPDVIYINSFFSKNYSIIPLQLIRRRRIRIKTILAPRGMLSEGALRIKPLKKNVFIRYAKLTGLYKNLLWHSTKADETSAVKKVFGNGVNIYEAQNVSDIQLRSPDPQKTKAPNELNLVYLGRIAENKNLLLMLKALQQIQTGNVSVDVYGSKEDEAYWKKCEELIADFPLNISVQYKGLLPAEKVSDTLRNYHFLILLSYSENFGHAIVEALSVGVPVIISNTTPWRSLQMQKAGWDVSIDTEKETLEALRAAIAMGQEEYHTYAEGAYRFAEKYCINPEVVEKLRLLFV